MADLLVVDDEKTLALALGRIFADAGHTVRVATSGQAAMDAIHAKSPDLVICDVKMPDMNGMQLLQAIRALSGCQNVPFLFISASVSPEREGKIAALGNVMYLRKPFEVDVLLDMVTGAIEPHA